MPADRTPAEQGGDAPDASGEEAPTVSPPLDAEGATDTADDGAGPATTSGTYPRSDGTGEDAGAAGTAVEPDAVETPEPEETEEPVEPDAVETPEPVEMAAVETEEPVETAAVDTEEPAETEEPVDDDRSTERLVADPVHLRSRWNDIQAAFVDEPGRSVADADALVAEVIDEISAAFVSTRADLAQRWSPADEVSTEDLRQAFRQYRSFFERLLAT